MTTNQGTAKVLVLLPVYNGSAFLHDQLSSIFAQMRVVVTVIVSIDGEDPESLATIREFIARGNSISVDVSGLHFGSAAQHVYHLFLKYASRLSEFDYVALSDQDDVWNPFHLSKSLHALQYKARATSCDLIAFYQDGKRRYVKKSFPQTPYDYYFESGSAGCTYVLTSDVAFRFSRFVEDNNEFCSSFESHDWLIYAWCRSNEIPWSIRSFPTVLYRQHGANAVGANLGFRAFANRMRLVRQGWYQRHIKMLKKKFPHTEGIDLSYYGRFRMALSSRRSLGERTLLVIFVLLNVA